MHVITDDNQAKATMREEFGLHLSLIDYIKKDLIWVAGVDRIAKAMEKYGKLKPMEFFAALLPNSPPNVRIADVSQSCCGYLSRNNELVIGKSYIGQDLAMRQESAYGLNIHGKPVLMAGVILLRLLVYWGNVRAGVPYGQLRQSLGDDFERKVYGIPVERKLVEITVYLS